MVYKIRSISSVSKSDKQVALAGKILEVMENSFILSDVTGEVEIFSEEKMEKGRIVRAFCSMVDGRAKLDFVQKLNDFDLNLYKKINELYTKAGFE